MSNFESRNEARRAEAAMWAAALAGTGLFDASLVITDDEEQFAPLALTVIDAVRPAVLSKGFSLDKDGNMLKQAGGNLVEGRAERFELPCASDFAELLASLGPHQALIHGVYPHEEAIVLSQTRADKTQRQKRQLPVVTRTRGDVSWPAGPGVMMLDYDPPADTTPLTAEKLREALYSVLPELTTAPHVCRPSASSCIYRKSDGVELRGVRGQRVYVFVQDARDIERAAKVLQARLWLSGQGYFAVSKAGSLLERTIVDGAVFQPERLDFAGGAKCGEGLEQRLPTPEVFNNEAAWLDTSQALPDLTVEEQRRLDAAKAATKAAKAPEAKDVQSAHQALRAEADADHAKITPEQRDAYVSGRKAFYERAYGSRDLYASFVVTMDDGQRVTVGEILANLSYDGRICCDPIEPEYDGGRAVGRIYTGGDKATIFSFAHGGCTYYLHEIEEDEWQSFLLDLGDAESGDGEEQARDGEPVDAGPEADAPQAGKTKGGDRYHRRPKGGVSLDDFYAYMPMHNFIYAPTRETWPGSSVDSRIPPVKLTKKNGEPLEDEAGNQKQLKATAWLDRHRPVEQMTWAPGEPMIIRNRLMANGGWIEKQGVSCFNLYMPPTLKHGSAADAGMWLEHVHGVYGDSAEHIIKWLAHRVQRPAEKINHALVLGGNQGVGKDTLLEPVKRAVGPWNFHEVSPTHIIGRFNGFLKSVILRVSEARDLGDTDRYKFYDHMKTLTAAPPDVLRVDEKHLREHYILNCCGVIITTNYKTDGIYLPDDDRRHFVAWTDFTKDDFDEAYWSELWGWYESGGIQNVAAYLAGLDISTSFNPKAPPPKTQAFWDIVDASRAPEDSELADAIDAMGAPDALTLDGVAARADDDLSEWIKDRKNRRIIPHRLETCGYTPVRNDTAESGLWVISGKRQVVYAKKNLPQRDRLAAASYLASRRSWKG